MTKLMSLPGVFMTFRPFPPVFFRTLPHIHQPTSVSACTAKHPPNYVFMWPPGKTPNKKLLPIIMVHPHHASDTLEIP